MTRSYRLQPQWAVSAAALLLGASEALAQDADFDRTPKNCVSLTSIDRTEVLDDRTILFYMRGKELYRNHLPRRCPGLEREKRFMYKTTTSRLCSIDTITVLEQFSSRLDPGFTCRLGEFQPITLEELEDLTIDDDGRRPSRNAIEVERVDLPRDAETEPSADSAATKTVEN